MRKLHAMQFTVNRTNRDGSIYTDTPKIFTVLPGSGSAFTPVAIGGINFNAGAIPYINNVSSASLFNFQQRNIPLLGSISVGFTIVPPAAPTGHGDVTVEYNSQRSNPFPFTVQ